MKHPYKSSYTLEMFSFLVDLELRLVAFAFFQVYGSGSIMAPPTEPSIPCALETETTQLWTQWIDIWYIWDDFTIYLRISDPKQLRFYVSTIYFQKIATHIQNDIEWYSMNLNH